MGKFRVLDKSLKRSFSNVRVDVVAIKDYLEKQHDMINREISTLQSQVFELRRELGDHTKDMMGEFATKSEFKNGLDKLDDSLVNLKRQHKRFDVEVEKLESSVDRIDVEKAEGRELDNNVQRLQRELDDLRRNLDKSFASLKLEVDKHSTAVQRKHAQLFETKLRRLEKSIDEVDELKRELKRSIRRKEPTKGLKKATAKSGWQRFWEGFVEFFEEEDEPEPEPVFDDEDDDVRLWPWVVLLLFILIAAGVGYLYFTGALPGVMAGVKGRWDNLVGPSELPEQPEEMIVIEVIETDHVDISPNVTDLDNDELTFTFSDPLDNDGQWQTEVGDAGEYPITVTVSDGEQESKLEFLLVVRQIS